MLTSFEENVIYYMLSNFVVKYNNYIYSTGLLVHIEFIFRFESIVHLKFVNNLILVQFSKSKFTNYTCLSVRRSSRCIVCLPNT